MWCRGTQDCSSASYPSQLTRNWRPCPCHWTSKICQPDYRQSHGRRRGLRHGLQKWYMERRAHLEGRWQLEMRSSWVNHLIHFKWSNEPWSEFGLHGKVLWGQPDSLAWLIERSRSSSMAGLPLRLVRWMEEGGPYQTAWQCQRLGWTEGTLTSSSCTSNNGGWFPRKAMNSGHPVGGWLKGMSPMVGRSSKRRDSGLRCSAGHSPETGLTFQSGHWIEDGTLRKGLPLPPTLYKRPSSSATWTVAPSQTFCP